MHSPIHGGFTPADVTVDQTAGTLNCPVGHTVHLGAVTPTATFGSRCTGCPLRARCTTSAHGRVVLLGEDEPLQRAHHTRAADPDVRAAYRRHRPMIERSIAWLTRCNLRVPYRGAAENDDWWHLRAAAIDLRRLLTLGLTGTDGHWALSAA